MGYIIKKEKKEEKTNIYITIKDLSLFRYRAITSNNLSAFINDEIWASTPVAFNDPYDTIFVYSKSKIIKEIGKLISQKTLEFFSEAWKISPRHKKNIIDRIYFELFHNIINETRKFFGIASFSEIINSEIMWGHYAGSARGFALEYDYYDLLKLANDFNDYINFSVKNINFFNLNLEDKYDKEDLQKVLPVFYINSKYNYENIMVEWIKQYFSLFEIDKPLTDIDGLKLLIKNIYSGEKTREIQTNILCRKNSCWKYEKEWRLFAMNSNLLSLGDLNNPYFKIGYLKPKAIYLGEFIHEYDKIALLKIAKEKEINIYQMYTSISKTKAYLKYREI